MPKRNRPLRQKTSLQKKRHADRNRRQIKQAARAVRQAQAAHGLIAGVDEVGRGPWAGPVVAAAVAVTGDLPLSGIRDSKRLSAAERDALAEAIPHHCACAIGIASVAEIDRFNILAASLLAMRRAVAKLPRHPSLALIDGPHVPDLACVRVPLVQGDRRCRLIAAAAIIAKTYRDGMMRDYAARYPGYGWESNAGYGTKAHRLGLSKFGITPLHRTSFAPVQACLRK